MSDHHPKPGPALAFIGLLVTLTLLLAILPGPGANRHATGGTLPLDPLTPAESRAAVRLALQDEAVDALIAGEPTRVVGAALHVNKTSLGVRAADVHIYRYESNDVVWPVVNLDEERVERVDVRNFQPVLTAAEVKEARTLALADQRLQNAFAGAPAAVKWAALRSPADEGACATHRCVALALTADGEEAPRAIARVDLSARVVDHVHTPGGRSP